jgi:hypothetical protein
MITSLRSVIILGEAKYNQATLVSLAFDFFMHRYLKRASIALIKKARAKYGGLIVFVGMTGFEPAASSSRTKRATGLRYIPLIGQK